MAIFRFRSVAEWLKVLVNTVKLLSEVRRGGSNPGEDRLFLAIKVSLTHTVNGMGGRMNTAVQKASFSNAYSKQNLSNEAVLV